MRINPTLLQKEETYQRLLPDIFKNFEVNLLYAYRNCILCFLSRLILLGCFGEYYTLHSSGAVLKGRSKNLLKTLPFCEGYVLLLNPTLLQKEETCQVIIDIIKNSICYNAFLITADVLEIYMQQFWYTVKKIKKTTSYKFDLADKKYIVDFEVFRKILGICLKVQGEEFVETPSKESLLTFLIELGYKSQLNKLPNMFVDYMHQPWRTLVAILNKCLSGKTSSNDHLRK
ncbi:hypothetical protein Tco_0769226 [Tanacetum coccineum]|uniref:Uncharacterized protein n=1 Tax=Tanacetum coccineum TaxID=301880 RepID=A0ABQ4ZC31_9ASTR